jgi:hypothetical protein
MEAVFPILVLYSYSLLKVIELSVMQQKILYKKEHGM